MWLYAGRTGMGKRQDGHLDVRRWAQSKRGGGRHRVREETDDWPWGWKKSLTQGRRQQNLTPADRKRQYLWGTWDVILGKTTSLLGATVGLKQQQYNHKAVWGRGETNRDRQTGSLVLAWFLADRGALPSDTNSLSLNVHPRGSLQSSELSGLWRQGRLRGDGHPGLLSFSAFGDAPPLKSKGLSRMWPPSLPPWFIQSDNESPLWWGGYECLMRKVSLLILGTIKTLQVSNILKVAQMVENPPAVQETWAGKIPWRREWQPIPVFLLGESHGQEGMMGPSPWCPEQLGTTEWMFKFSEAASGKEIAWECRQCSRDKRCR